MKLISSKGFGWSLCPFMLVSFCGKIILTFSWEQFYLAIKFYLFYYPHCKVSSTNTRKVDIYIYSAHSACFPFSCLLHAKYSINKDRHGTDSRYAVIEV